MEEGAGRAGSDRTSAANDGEPLWRQQALAGMCGRDRPVGLTGRNRGSALPIPKYRTANIPGQDWVFRGPGQVFQFIRNVSTFTSGRKKKRQKVV